VDAGFDENEAEFGVLVFAVALEVLADSDGLEIELRLDQFSELFVTSVGLLGDGLGEIIHTFLINM
jgi:hypothetical protein